MKYFPNFVTITPVVDFSATTSLSIQPSILFSENFNSGIINWETIQYGSGGTAWSVDNYTSYGFSGTTLGNKVGIYIGQYDDNANIIVKTKNKISAINITDVTLSFLYTIGGNANDYGTVVYSFDGSTWSDWTSTQYRTSNLVQINDLSPTIDLSGQSFYLGFRIFANPTTHNNPGWIIDDIIVKGKQNVTTFYNLSKDYTDYSWSFTGGTPSTSINENPTILYHTGGSYSVSLTASKGIYSATETKLYYINVTPNLEVEIVNGNGANILTTGATSYYLANETLYYLGQSFAVPNNTSYFMDSVPVSQLTIQGSPTINNINRTRNLTYCFTSTATVADCDLSNNHNLTYFQSYNVTNMNLNLSNTKLTTLRLIMFSDQSLSSYTFGTVKTISSVDLEHCLTNIDFSQQSAMTHIGLIDNGTVTYPNSLGQSCTFEMTPVYETVVDNLVLQLYNKRLTYPICTVITTGSSVSGTSNTYLTTLRDTYGWTWTP